MRHGYISSTTGSCVYGDPVAQTDECSRALFYNVELGVYTPQFVVPNGPVVRAAPIQMRAQTTVHLMLAP